MRTPGRLAASVFTLVVLCSPGEARAQGSGPDLSGLAVLGIAAVAVGGGVVVGGLVTDGMVLHDLVAGQGVRRPPAIAGTVLWGVASAALIPVTVASFSGSEVDGELVAVVLSADALALSSLALSIYALTLPAPRSGPGPAPWSQRVSALPAAIPAARGVAPGLVVSFSL